MVAQPEAELSPGEIRLWEFYHEFPDTFHGKKVNYSAGCIIKLYTLNTDYLEILRKESKDSNWEFIPEDWRGKDFRPEIVRELVENRITPPV